MAKIPNIVPITDLRQDASRVVKRAATLRQPLVITQRGRAAAVLVGIKDYQHTQGELEILRLLARGQKEIETGIGHELDDVLADADVLLKELQR